MEKLRTPDERFNDLVDWPFEPRYVNLESDLRVHYIDEEQAQPCCSCTESQLEGTCIEMIPPLSTQDAR